MEMKYKILDLLGFPVKEYIIEKEWTPVYHYLENHTPEETNEHFGPIIDTMREIYTSKHSMRRLVASLDNIYNTLTKKGLDTEVVDVLKEEMFNDKQIAYLVSLKYGLNGQQQMDETDWKRLVAIIVPNLSMEQIKMIAKLIVRGRTDEQIALVEKYNLTPEEMAIVDQNFFDINETLEQTKAWIERYL